MTYHLEDHLCPIHRTSYICPSWQQRWLLQEVPVIVFLRSLLRSPNLTLWICMFSVWMPNLNREHQQLSVLQTPGSDCEDSVLLWYPELSQGDHSVETTWTVECRAHTLPMTSSFVPKKIISDTHFHLLCCVWLATKANHTQQRERESRENQVVRSGFCFHSAIQTKSNGLKGELRPFWSHRTCYIQTYVANTPGYSALFRGCRSLVGLALYA